MNKTTELTDSAKKTNGHRYILIVYDELVPETFEKSILG
jgi:hypothetical protein